MNYTLPPLDMLIHQEWPVLALVCVLFLAGLFQFRPAERRNVFITTLFFLIAGMGLWLGLTAQRYGMTSGGMVLQEASTIALGAVVIRLFGLTFFRLILSVIGMEPPRILEDVIVFVGYVAWGMTRLHIHGLDLSSLVTTSAVITAVAAFSMQDTLGNILSGVALQLDDSLELGQWIKLPDVSGKVLQIGWRSTLIETRNGETIVIPNAWLMKNSFQIIGKRGAGGSLQWRRWVWFELSWEHPPAKVIEVMQNAANKANIATVAADPAPQAVLMDMKNGIARYALRYWLNDFARDDPTDSQVRAHVMAALMRHGLPLATDSHNVWMTKDNEKTAATRHEHELARRLAALRGVTLFKGFTEDELRQLADKLVFAPFEKGDIVSRQGDVAHWLYILAAGDVEVWHDYDKPQRDLVGRLASGSFFGEMGLMTGAPRSATVVAMSYVECFRLDSASFEAIITARPELAEVISTVLAQRLAENLRRLPEQDRPAPPPQSELVERIRHFFRLH